MPPKAVRNPKNLLDLVQVLYRSERFVGVVSALERGESGAVDGAWGAACALVVSAIAQRCPGRLVVVLPRIGDVDEFADDVANFSGETPLVFPAWESLPQEFGGADAVWGSRLRAVQALSESSGAQLIVTSIPALLQPVPSHDAMAEATRSFQCGDVVELESLLHWLVERGCQRVNGIEQPGEFAVRGGILDLFAPGMTDPVRFEFFGDEIESMRRFDAETQRTIDSVDRVELTLVSPKTVAQDVATSGRMTGAHFLDALPDGSWIVLAELTELVEEGRQFLDRLDDPRGMFTVESALEHCTSFPTVAVASLAGDSMETSCHLQIESIERFTGPKDSGLQELDSAVGRDERVLIACHNEAEKGRLAELLAEKKVSAAKRITLCVGRISRGFRLVTERLVVLSDHELFGRTEVRRMPGRRRIEMRAIDSFLDLKVGDLVVHLTHGIGRYRGMKSLDKDGRKEEHLVIEFRDKVQVYVPVSLIHLVQRYVGAAKAVPQLSKLGSSAWAKKKRKVAEAVGDLAADMLRLQAARETRPGIAFPPDSHWQKEFDAAFPYTETDDQIDAIQAVKEDMERRRPMDRLICGDVGYGKTEVAMRAVFKTVDAGRQVAVLVPTTVLAEQHYRTFAERMAEYPIAIESLSRFKTRAEQRNVLEGMASGTVDVVIGTHRLIQADVRFKNLGLLVIDEEQRFGVEAKEMLKKLRLEVDVLTLSATPIPRTLHMALLGVRDISNLETPPQDRTAIVTRVSRFDPELIRHAIVRELNRNGQVYFVHNRVHDILAVAEIVQQIVPEARIDIGHGQMPPHELEETMVRFVSGHTDVLVCTTIIESGLDIPNANTILIHCADQFGLADLHQLRGRVGRYKYRAYCYLVLQVGRLVTPNAAKRLKAVEEYSELGAGFKIAMRDLEIRGAGNLLGTEQSGHIAAVGYELYCRLLEDAARHLQGLPVREHRHVHLDLPISALLPHSFVSPGRQKIEVYRKLSSVQTYEELQDLEAELRDRFGRLPSETMRLLEVKNLQILARSWTVDEIRIEDKHLVLGYRDGERLRELTTRVPGLRIVDGRHAYLRLPGESLRDEDLIAFVKSVLQPIESLRYNSAPS